MEVGNAGLNAGIRSSEQAWIGKTQNNEDEVSTQTESCSPLQISDRIKQRIANLTAMPVDLMESIQVQIFKLKDDTLQVIHYRQFGHFHFHHDYIEGEQHRNNPYYLGGGNRLITVLMYLSDVLEGQSFSSK